MAEKTISRGDIQTIASKIEALKALGEVTGYSWIPTIARQIDEAAELLLTDIIKTIKHGVSDDAD